jgi:hypothetical protein
VVPVFNYGRYLEACLRSVLSQDGIDLNVLVLDDSSADDSLSIARKISDEDSRVHVIAHEQNLGHIPTVNEGIAAANSEYVVKLDADDMLTEGSLKRSVALLEAFPTIGFVYGLPWIIKDGATPFIQSPVRSWTVWPGQEWLKKRVKTGTNCIRQPEAVIRLSALREVGPYDKKLPHTSDFEMWMRLAAHYDVGRVNGAYQGFYREHPASMSRTIHHGLLTDVSERARAVDTLLSECSTLLPEVNRMSDIAHRALAREALSHAISTYTTGAVDQGSIDDYLALALKIWPDAERLRDWRLACHLNSADTLTFWRRLSLAGRETLRDLRWRLRWRRWRWSGT